MLSFKFLYSFALICPFNKPLHWRAINKHGLFQTSYVHTFSFPLILIYFRRVTTVINHFITIKQSDLKQQPFCLHDFIAINLGRAQVGGFPAGLPGIM